MSVEAYMAALETVLLLLNPALLVLVVYAWIFAYRFRQRENRLGLPTAIALKVTLAFICATILSFATLYRARIGPLPEEWLPIQATAVVVLIITSFLTILYLFVLDIVSYSRNRG